MKVYFYDYQKAQNNHYSFSISKIVLFIVICTLLIFTGLGLTFLTNNFIFMLLFPVSIVLIIWYILNVIKYRRASLKTFVKDNNTNDIYLIINNNLSDLSWMNTISKFVLGQPSFLVNDYMYNKSIEEYNQIQKVMSNEKILKWIIENPKDKKSKGIEIYKILSINSLFSKNNNETKINFDGLELSNDLVFKNKDELLLNVYSDYEELNKELQNCKQGYNFDDLKINDKMQKKYNNLFNENYHRLRFTFVLYFISVILGILSMFLSALGVNIVFTEFGSVILIALFFSIVLMLFEPTKNTNLCGKNEPKKILISTLALLIIYFIFLFGRIFL